MYEKGHQPVANAASTPPGASNPPARSGWTPIPNAIISHPELSVDARMILIWLLSHTPEFLATVNAQAVERLLRLSRRAVAAALKELEAAGYLVRERVPGPGGRAVWAPWVVRMAPQGGETNTPADLPLTDSPSTECPSADSPSAVGPYREDQSEKTSREDQVSDLDDDDLARTREQNHHVDNPQDGDPAPAAAVAGTAPPDPQPPLPTTGTSTAGTTPGSKKAGGQTPAAIPPVDLVQVLVDLVHEVTGRTIDHVLAGKGVAMVLRAKDGTPRTVSDPVAYLRTAVEAAPARFLPSVVPPTVGSSARCKQHGLRQPCDHCAGRGYGSPRGGRFDYPQRETPEIDPDTGWPSHMSHGRRKSKRERTARIIDEFAVSAAEATDGGQRLDNTGVTVVDQNGQAAGTAPAEPLNGPWADEPVTHGWMSIPVIPDSPSDDGPCGHCDGHTRLYQRDDGRMARCPTCHPLRHERKSA